MAPQRSSFGMRQPFAEAGCRGCGATRLLKQAFGETRAHAQQHHHERQPRRYAAFYNSAMPFNPDKLHWLSKARDRKPPLQFVGRENTLASIRSSIADLEGGEPQGETQIVRGAPGSGKTALLDHLPEWLGGTAYVVRAHTSFFNDPEVLMTSVIREVDSAKLPRRGRTTVKAGVAGLGGERTFERGALPRNFHEAERLLQPKRPVAIVVDEAQNLADNAAPLLQELHEGVPNFMLVCGGLGNTEERLAELGVSRLMTGHSHALGGLSVEEQIEAIDAFMGLVDWSIEAERNRWTEELVSEAQGWPQHLANAMRAAAQEVLKANGQLEEADLKAVLHLSRAYRREYYRGRVLSFSNRELEAILKSLESHEAMPDELFKRALHKGVIQQRDDGDYDIPIPSMAKYVRDRALARKR